MTAEFGLGLRLDEEDRDWLAAHAVEFPANCSANGSEIPEEFSIPLTVKNQGRTNACAGFSGSSLFEALNYLATGEIKIFAAWWLYRQAAKLGGWGRRDEGTSISSILQWGLQNGCCLETSSPFPGGRFVNDFPDQAPFNEARQHPLGQFTSVRGYDATWRYLTTQGPIQIGTKWFEGQARRGDGIERLADMSGDLLGYHARLLCGWSKQTDAKGRHLLRVLNSHGDGERLVEPDVVDWWADDPLMQSLGASEVRAYEPTPVQVWRPNPCAI